MDIIKLAEMQTGKEFGVIETLTLCIDKGFIYYNFNNQNDDNNFFVKNPDKMLTFLTDIAWSVSKEPATYRLALGEWEIDRWERVKTGVTTGHFRLPEWDSLQDSQTVKFGNLASKRIFRKV